MSSGKFSWKRAGLGLLAGLGILGGVACTPAPATPVSTNTPAATATATATPTPAPKSTIRGPAKILTEPKATPAATPKPIYTIPPTPTAISYGCRNMTGVERGSVADYLNRTGMVKELYGEGELKNFEERGMQPLISASEIVGGFAYGDERIFVVVTPQLKSARMELFVLRDKQVAYRSGGIGTYGVRGIEQKNNCQEITLDLDIAGKYVFARQDGTYKIK